MILDGPATLLDILVNEMSLIVQSVDVLIPNVVVILNLLDFKVKFLEITRLMSAFLLYSLVLTD